MNRRALKPAPIVLPAAPRLPAKAGKENIIGWRKRFPTALAFKVRRIRGQGDLRVAENSISYDGGSWSFVCSILEFRGDKVARETVYINEGWEAPEWREPWRAEWEEES